MRFETYIVRKEPREQEARETSENEDLQYDLKESS